MHFLQDGQNAHYISGRCGAYRNTHHFVSHLCGWILSLYYHILCSDSRIACKFVNYYY